jgi:hypothetical protein
MSNTQEGLEAVNPNLPVDRFSVQKLAKGQGTTSNTQEGLEAVKRLNLNLPVDRFSRVQKLAKSRGTTISDLVRLAVNLLLRIFDGFNSEGKRIAVFEVDENDRIIKELVFDHTRM